MFTNKKWAVILALVAMIATVLPANAAPPAQEEMTYTVKLGDNLWTLAEKYLGSGPAYSAIVGATNDRNATDSSFAKIVNPSLIHPGWKLLIPGPEEAAKYVPGLPAPAVTARAQNLIVAVDGRNPDPTNFNMWTWANAWWQGLQQGVY